MEKKLPEILAKGTGMTVLEIEDQIPAKANHVYVAPRGHNVTIHGGLLGIEPATERGRPPLPIDFFFRAHAQDRTRRAAGIVLSCTGTDGTLGLAAIRAEGGLSLVQAPETAEFEGMPTSSIAASVRFRAEGDHSFPHIERVVQKGQEVLFQVTKEMPGPKGAQLTTYISLAGRYLVLTPGRTITGVSRKIEEDEERQRLKSAIVQLKIPEELGYIVRTVAIGLK